MNAKPQLAAEWSLHYDERVYRTDLAGLEYGHDAPPLLV